MYVIVLVCHALRSYSVASDHSILTVKRGLSTQHIRRCFLFVLDRCRGLRREIVEDAVDALDLGCDPHGEVVHQGRI